MQMQKQQEEQGKLPPELEIVTAVDDWFDLGAMFGCFSREK